MTIDKSHAAHKTYRDWLSFLAFISFGVNFRTKPEAGPYRYECLAATLRDRELLNSNSLKIPRSGVFTLHTSMLPWLVIDNFFTVSAQEIIFVSDSY